MRTFSIRTHLLLLVLAGSIPLVAAVAYDSLDEVEQADLASKASLRTLAMVMASNTAERLAAARLALELLGPVGFADPAGCPRALQKLTQGQPNHLDVFLTTSDGRVLCAASGAEGSGKRAGVENSPWFQGFVKAGSFQVAPPHVDELTGEQVSVLSVPLWQRLGERLGAAHLVVKLEAFDPLIPTQFLPADSRYGFFSNDGILVWRNLDPEHVIGTRPDAEAARTIVKMREGEFEALAVDGVTRLFSVVPMPGTGWVAFIGVPSFSVQAASRQRVRTSAATSLGAIALLVVLGIAVARRIGRPLSELERVARAVHQGDFAVRASLEGPRDIAEVARALNEMATARQRSEEELRAFLENSAVIA